MRMSALDTALDTIDAVAGEGDLAPTRALGHEFELESTGEPIALPDGRRICPPRLHGQPVDELACALLDMHDPARSTFLRLIGPPDAAKSQIARHASLAAWDSVHGLGCCSGESWSPCSRRCQALSAGSAAGTRISRGHDRGRAVDPPALSAGTLVGSVVLGRPSG
jgi:hypothetical protein